MLALTLAWIHACTPWVVYSSNGWILMASGHCWGWGVSRVRSWRDSSQPKLNPGFCIAGFLGLGLFMPDFYSLLWKEDSVGQNESSACWRPGEKPLNPWQYVEIHSSVKRLTSFSLRLMYHAMTVGGYSSLSAAWEGLSGTWNQDTGPETHLLKRTHLLAFTNRLYQYIKENQWRGAMCCPIWTCAFPSLAGYRKRTMILL